MSESGSKVEPTSMERRSERSDISVHSAGGGAKDGWVSDQMAATSLLTSFMQVGMIIYPLSIPRVPEPQ